MWTRLNWSSPITAKWNSSAGAWFSKGFQCLCVWVRLVCKCVRPAGCELEWGPSPAACAAADEPGSVFGPAAPGPAGRWPSVSLGTTVHPGSASDEREREVKALTACQKKYQWVTRFRRGRELLVFACLILTWSSSIILTDRSFSSCCLSSIISLRKSSVFSSSRMSGEPIPSSFSSARLLFGEEPLNSWGGRKDWK